MTTEEAKKIIAQWDEKSAANILEMYRKNELLNPAIASRAVLELELENAKLRELCSALYEFSYYEYPDSAELNFSDHMHELGIEVTCK